MTRSSAPDFRLIRTLAELESLRPAWEKLWESDPDATPFQHPAWLLPWWHAFGQPDLRVGTLRQEEELLALLPLYVLSQPSDALLLLLGAGTSDYLDAVLSPTCLPEDVGSLVRATLKAPGWQVSHLNQLRSRSRMRAALEALRAAGLQVETYAGEPCCTCPASTVADLPGKLRGDVRYFRNAAISQGKLCLRKACATELEETFALLVRFHTERWQQAGEPGVLADPSVLAHHRKALPQLEEAGLLRLMRLELAGNPIAVLYSFIDQPERLQRTQYFYLMGYAIEHAELRPGVLLTALASEYAVAEGVTTIDMLRGGEAYKQFWRVEPVPTFGYASIRRRPSL